jgi:hypothetical protein
MRQRMYFEYFFDEAIRPLALMRKECHNGSSMKTT